MSKIFINTPVTIMGTFFNVKEQYEYTTKKQEMKECDKCSKYYYTISKDGTNYDISEDYAVELPDDLNELTTPPFDAYVEKWHNDNYGCPDGDYTKAYKENLGIQRDSDIDGQRSQEKI